jgi:2-dehydro-3-deoxyphosphogluconate aldolase / (4S)-4-hydroxy-2-oxoglutarate aldolase
MNSILAKLGAIGLIPVVKIEDAEKASALAKALIEGGLPCVEIAFRSEAAAAAIGAIAKAYPDMLLGAGTVISVDLAEKAVAAGAQFIVAPGFNPEVVDWCIAKKIPVVPGVSGPTEIEAALGRGLEVLKLFPAEVLGGVAMLDALAGPFSQVSFIPTGGVGPANIAEYARRDNVFAIGGTWMVKTELIEKEDWAAISALCREAVVALHGFSFAHLGINQAGESEASATASLFALFGLAPKPGASSIFNDTVIEVMKIPMRGTKGHIGFKCCNIERALRYLGQYGFHGVEETAKRERGRLSFIYLDKEIGGFAVHLLKAK